MSVTVTILTSNEQAQQNETNLARLFEGSPFEIYYLGNDRGDASFLQALRNTPPGNYSIVLRGSSVSTASPQLVKEVIQRVMESPQSVSMAPGKENNDPQSQEPQWHLCYLCRWNDRCDLYKNYPIEELPESKTSIVRTSHPTGTQAILFSPRGREMVLGTQPLLDGNYLNFQNGLDQALQSAITRGALIARCVVPNIFEYNVLLGNYTGKTQDCLPENSPKGGNELQGNQGLTPKLNQGSTPKLGGELPPNTQPQIQPQSSSLSPWIYIIPIGLIVLIILACVFFRKR